MIQPLFYLAAAVVPFTSKAQKQQLFLSYKKAFKKFCLIPRSCADKMLLPLMGEFEKEVGRRNLKTCQKILRRNNMANPMIE